MAYEITVIGWDKEYINEICSSLEYLNVEYKLITTLTDIQKITSVNRSLIIIDILLPKKPGFLVCQEIKDRYPESKSALLIPSSADAEEMKRRWNADYIIVKPLHWKKVAEILTSEKIPFIPPIEEGKCEPNEITQILLDTLLFHKKCHLEIECEDEQASLKIYEGWTELNGGKKLIDMMKEESLNFRTHPLKELPNEENLVHISQIIKSCVNELKKKVYFPAQVVHKIHLVENITLPEYLLPSERAFIKRVKEGGELILKTPDSYRKWEKEKFEEMLYYLTVLNIITIEYELLKREEHDERKEQVIRAPGEEEVSETIEEEKKETEKQKIPEEISEDTIAKSKGILPPEEQEEEEKGVSPSTKEVILEPPEELELIRKYPEERYKKMSTYENLDEDEVLLEEILPHTKPDTKESREETVETHTTEFEENVKTDKEKHMKGKEITERIVSPAREKEEISISQKPVEEKKIKKGKKTLIWIGIIIATLIFTGVITATIFITTSKVSLSDELIKAEKILDISSYNEFKKLLGNIKHNTVKLLILATAYDAGFVKKLPQLLPSPQDEIGKIYNSYLLLLKGEPFDLPKNLNISNNRLTRFIYARALIIKNLLSGKNIMTEISGWLPLITSIRFACQYMTKKDLKKVLKTDNEIWIKEAIECAWRKMDYNTVVEIYLSYPFQNPEIKTWVGISYLKTNKKEAGEKLLLEAGTDEAYYALGEEMEKRGKSKEAVKYYSLVKSGIYFPNAKRRIEKLLSTEKQKRRVNISKLLSNGISAKNKGKNAIAKRYLNKVLSIEPSNPDAHYHIGMIYLEEGNISVAKKYLNQFLKNAPSGDKRIEEVKDILKYLH